MKLSFKFDTINNLTCCNALKMETNGGKIAVFIRCFK